MAAWPVARRWIGWHTIPGATMIRPSASFATPLLLLVAMASPADAQVAITRTTPPESAVDAIFKRYDSKDTPAAAWR